MVDLVPLNVNGMPFRLISVHLWNWALALLSVILDLSASAVLHDPRRPQGKRWKLSTVQYKHHNTMLLTQLYHADQTIQLTIQEMTAELQPSIKQLFFGMFFHLQASSCRRTIYTMYKLLSSLNSVVDCVDVAARQVKSLNFKLLTGSEFKRR